MTQRGQFRMAFDSGRTSAGKARRSRQVERSEGSASACARNNRAGVGRCLCSLFSRPFVCECHSISTVPRFQSPPRRTQRADFPLYALLGASAMASPCAVPRRTPSQARPPAPERFQVLQRTRLASRPALAKKRRRLAFPTDAFIRRERRPAGGRGAVQDGCGRTIYYFD
jgi:hypothetical protein